MAPPLRLGNFLICLGPPGPGVAIAGAAPIVKRVPPDEVDGASGTGPLKGDGGATAPNPDPPPKPLDVDTWGSDRLTLPPEGDAG